MCHPHCVFAFAAKVAKQIVDYYSQALGTLEPNSGEDNPVSDTVGSKIYKVEVNFFTHVIKEKVRGNLLWAERGLGCMMLHIVVMACIFYLLLFFYREYTLFNI